MEPGHLRPEPAGPGSHQRTRHRWVEVAAEVGQELPNAPDVLPAAEAAVVAQEVHLAAAGPAHRSGAPEAQTEEALGHPTQEVAPAAGRLHPGVVAGGHQHQQPTAAPEKTAVPEQTKALEQIAAAGAAAPAVRPVVPRTSPEAAEAAEPVRQWGNRAGKNQGSARSVPVAPEEPGD